MARNGTLPKRTVIPEGSFEKAARPTPPEKLIYSYSNIDSCVSQPPSSPALVGSPSNLQTLLSELSVNEWSKSRVPQGMLGCQEDPIGQPSITVQKHINLREGENEGATGFSKSTKNRCNPPSSSAASSRPGHETKRPEWFKGFVT